MMVIQVKGLEQCLAFSFSEIELFHSYTVILPDIQTKHSK